MPHLPVQVAGELQPLTAVVVSGAGTLKASLENPTGPVVVVVPVFQEDVLITVVDGSGLWPTVLDGGSF